MVAEIPVTFAEARGEHVLGKLPNIWKNMTFKEARYKPTSKYFEVDVAMPKTNVSALRAKQLSRQCATYKSLCSASHNYFFPVCSDNRLSLQKVDYVALFSYKHNAPAEKEQEALFKKAESREELAHRKKNINFKLRTMEKEEFLVLETTQVANKARINLSDFVPEETGRNARRPERSASEEGIAVSHYNLESKIKNARIVNIGVLKSMFRDEDAIKTALCKMTEQVAGRFILKNAYYERYMHSLRDRMLSLFRPGGSVAADALGFIRDEFWLVEEIADVDGSVYVLKGYDEDPRFDVEEVEDANRKLVARQFRGCRMLSYEQICGGAGVDRDAVLSIVEGSGFRRLANGAYVKDDRSYWFSPVLALFVEVRSREMAEVKDVLDKDYDDADIVAELKHYCTQRNGKYFLKNVK